MGQVYTWKERLKDSSWVTIGWDWFMTFLGRVVEAALWITMIFSCYQLIPGAPQPAPTLGNVIFIIQFVALDVGGIGLKQAGAAAGASHLVLRPRHCLYPDRPYPGDGFLRWSATRRDHHPSPGDQRH